MLVYGDIRLAGARDSQNRTFGNDMRVLQANDTQMAWIRCGVRKGHLRVTSGHALVPAKDAELPHAKWGALARQSLCHVKIELGLDTLLPSYLVLGNRSHPCESQIESYETYPQNPDAPVEVTTVRSIN